MTRARFSAAALAALATLAALSAAREAGATQFRRPFNAGLSLGYGYDHNGGAAGCLDFACGGKCYDGHRGNDFPLPAGTDVVAGANGTVIFVNNGCPNVGFIGSGCGGGAGNYVKIQHADGRTTMYMHMMLNSIVVGVGQNVSCGQKLGLSASSGNSSGNHLHFEPRSGATAIDPFAGNCNGPTSLWVNQNGYFPTTDCENLCACSPGQVDTQGCGNCGVHSRVCQGNCQWGGFGSCDGQGPCAPGQQDSMPCGDCGTTTRVCNGACAWGGFGACGGPDPEGGNQYCKSGNSGPPCDEGRVRCVEGYLHCKPVYEPQPETCDGLDNDCNDRIDDGHPSQLSSPPPAFAATLLDVSAPQALPAGERGLVWAELRNDGAQPWPKGGIWFEALGEEDAASRFFAPGAWPAYDVTTVLDRPVQPGETARFTFPITAPDSPGEEVIETFQLARAGGPAIACPRADIEVRLRVLPKPAAADEAQGGAAAASAAKSFGHGQSGCSLAASAPVSNPSAAAALALVALLGAGRRNRRRSDRSGH